MISRRGWLQSVISFAGVATVPSPYQERPSALVDTSNLFAMDQGAARSVRLPDKPGAQPSMTDDERDALEHKIRCQCGCTLDVFTCRTTDFSCQVSPSMHRDVMALVRGGYTAPEILDTFVKAYGDRVLMAPPKVGFNVVGYVLPGIGIAVGAIVLAVLIRRWRAPARHETVQTPFGTTDATPDELRRLDEAVRDDS